MVTCTTVVLASLTGALAGSLLACVPGLHVYNVIALIVVFSVRLGSAAVLPTEALACAVIGLVVAYAMLSTIPSILLAAPDESAFFTTLPGQRYLQDGRGYAAVWLTVVGSLAGVMATAAGYVLAAPCLLPTVWLVFRPHTHWVLWCVIAFMLLSEWPKGGSLGQAGVHKLAAAWTSLGAGLLTFLLSAMLGFILLHRSPMAPEAAFQNLMPAFIGLFTVPWLLLNGLSRTEIPAQRIEKRIVLERRTFLQGALAGVLGGGFAAFFPVITGGVGAFLAGHATALRNDRAFMISQGAARMVYYAGGLLLLFVPGAALVRGGAAAMLRTLFTPFDRVDFWMAAAAMLIAAASVCLLARPLTCGVLRAMAVCGYRAISWASLGLVALIVFAVTGLMGVLVALVAAAIGLIPLLCGARRMNCLGVILLPMACNLSGFGPQVAAWLGLQ